MNEKINEENTQKFNFWLLVSAVVWVLYFFISIFKFFYKHVLFLFLKIIQNC